MNKYQQVQSQTLQPTEFSNAIFKSIRLYLQDYKNTSNTKDARRLSLESARKLTEWATFQFQTTVTTFEGEIILYGFNKILDSIAEAQRDFSTIHNVNDSIGFLAILEGSIINKK